MQPTPQAPAPRGEQYWRRLPSDQDAATAESRREFADGADVVEMNDVSRREFLGVMGASLALAGLSTTGCTHLRKTPEEILPYARRPEDLVPGRAMFFATAAHVAGSVLGLLVESHEGRPTKIEGNPDHPMSLGGTSVWAQAEILGFYDPDRSTSATQGASASTVDAAIAALAARLAEAKASGGLGIVTDARPSRTRQRLIDALAAATPGTRVFVSDATARTASAAGARLAGAPAGTRAVPDLSKAAVIAAFDADFLGTDGDAVRHSRHFASRRKPEDPSAEMNRLYAVEAAFTLTGALADHRLRVKSSRVAGVLAALATRLGVPADAAAALAAARVDDADKRFLDALADDLRRAGSSALVLVGERQPAAAHALAHLIHEQLGAIGNTVSVVADAAPAGEGLAALAEALRGGSVKTLVVLGANPAHDAPGDLKMAEAIGACGFSLHLGLTRDETARACQWHVPQAHWLEAWDDLVAADGTVAITQPLIAPLHGGISDIELLARASGDASPALALVQATAGLDAAAWKAGLQKGVIPGAAPAVAAAPASPRDLAPLAAALAAIPAAGDGLEADFILDMSILDGRYANNAWLQELPDPMTKMTWDNVVSVSKATAAKLSVKDGDVLEVKTPAGATTIPVFVAPGIADDVLVLPLGYGRADLGRVANGVGSSVAALRAAASPYWASATASATGRRVKLATTQEHGTLYEDHGPHLERADLVRETRLDQWREEPMFIREMDIVSDELLANQLFKSPNQVDGQQWGMTIDLSACTGCSACTIACQAENNIPVVGRDRVLQGREMHWIRVDRYFRGPEENPDAAIHQPVPCMQCETAPCEQVCPVAATTHSTDGLNDMVYNRCIGTRYCANNCPYKVRRFNFFNYARENDTLMLPGEPVDDRPILDQVFQKNQPATLLALQRNPNVTVRFRGVMEKCTYCVQRISRSRIDAKVHGDGVIPDGGVVTACQQACPADAIAFGDINDPKSRVSRLKATSRNYTMLTELRTRPRTSYLARVRNPNPALAPAPAPAAAGGGGHHG